MTRKNPPKVWFVPVNRTVTYANQPGVMRVSAPTAKAALARAMRFEDADYNGIDWEGVNEIYEVAPPVIAADLQPDELTLAGEA